MYNAHLASSGLYLEYSIMSSLRHINVKNFHESSTAVVMAQNDTSKTADSLKHTGIALQATA